MIVAMLYALGQLVIVGPRLLTNTTGIILQLEELAEESDLVDETVVSSLVADQEQRRGIFTDVIVVMVIAILANVVANYLGRGRHHANTARIRELEAELRWLRSVFLVSEMGPTFDELEPPVKNQVSRRARAASKAKALLASLLREQQDAHLLLVSTHT